MSLELRQNADFLNVRSEDKASILCRASGKVVQVGPGKVVQAGPAKGCLAQRLSRGSWNEAPALFYKQS